MRPHLWLFTALVLVGCAPDKRAHARGDDAGVAAGSPPGDGGAPTLRPGTRTGRANPIPAENARAGAPDWSISKNCPGREIEGYSPHPSVTPGEAVPFAVSVDGAPTTFTWSAYRLGHYGGLGAREVARNDTPVQVSTQPACPMDATTGLVACAWSTTFSLSTGTDWVPGLYLVRLTRADGFQRYVPFFLRDDFHYGQVLVGVATSTWEAYNVWGGESLYNDLHHLFPKYGHAFAVSYDRPYDRDDGAGQLLTYEHNLARWLEAQGLDVTYATTAELDADPSLFVGPRVVIVPGHDEYWTRQQRDHMDAAVAAGVSLLNFGANNGYWQIRLSSAADGRPARVITGYKDAAQSLDPVGPQSPDLTTKFRALAVPRPENALFGEMFNSQWNEFAMPLVVSDTSHWAFQGTGLQPGDTILQVNGYETDQLVPQNGQQPPGMELLTTSPVLGLVDVWGYGQMALRQQGNAVVFTSGGIDFTRALAEADRADPRLQRLAANVLYRALGTAVPPLPTFTSPGPRLQPAWAAAAFAVAGARGTPGDADGPVGAALLGAPTAVAAQADGGLVLIDMPARKLKRVDASGVQTVTASLDTPFDVVVDSGGTAFVSELQKAEVLAVSPDGTIQVLAGAAFQYGTADGNGTSARFVGPAGLALGPQGLYVTDVLAGSIRYIDLSNPSHPVSTLVSGLSHPSAIALAPGGTAYVADTGNARVIAVSPSHAVSLLAGTGVFGYVDGPGGQAELSPYMGIAVLPDGSVAFSDPGGYRIRRINPATGEVTTYAGTGRFGQQLGGGGGTDVAAPAGLAVGPHGTLYVAEAGNADVLALQP